MRLTDARQLDALPEGTRGVLVHGALSTVYRKTGDGWTCGDGLVHKSRGLALCEVYLLEATARTPEDLDRLLPGAVLEGGDSKDEDGIWWGPGSEVDWDSQRMARSLPLAILHPGNPDDTKEA